MLNNIFKIMTLGKLKFPIVSVVLSVGVLGLNYIAEQNKQFLSSTNLTTNYVAPNTQNEISSHPDLLSKLRNTKQQTVAQNSQNINNFDGNNLQKFFPDKLTENGTKLSKNIRELEPKNSANFPDKDGIYTYGQSSIANQTGNGYIVFQKQKGKIIGALYVPESEFSCFQGTLEKSGELAMTVNSSPGEVGIMQVSTTSNIPKISDQESTSYAHSVNLQNYHKLSNVSDRDKQILQMCKQDAGGFR